MLLAGVCCPIGNFDWVGNEFMFNAGAGMVISQAEGVKEKNSTLVEQVRATFERDWYSRHTKSLQANKIPVCNKHQLNQLAHLKITQPTESNGSKEGPNGSLWIRRCGALQDWFMQALREK